MPIRKILLYFFQKNVCPPGPKTPARYYPHLCLSAPREAKNIVSTMGEKLEALAWRYTMSDWWAWILFESP